MKANETKFQDLVATNYQYVVPLFQRPYSWTRKEWAQLWEDIKDLMDNDVEHFIGSIVNIPTPSVPAGVSKFLLIDGQQRMTTLFIVLMVIRDIAKQNGISDRADEINDMIVNRHKKEDDHFKLMPTQIDRSVYRNLVLGNIRADDLAVGNGIQDCYRFFRQQIASSNWEHVFQVISERLSIVSIVLDKDDNPHIVFESLNAKGRSLTQSDLIRNYFFMRIHVDLHESMNSDYWQPMQEALGENTTEFIRHYLMSSGTNVRQPDVYQVLKQRIETEKHEILSYLQKLARHSGYYSRILNPERFEKDPDLQRLMRRLNTLQATVAYPFLLRVYSDADEGQITRDEHLRVLQTLENYIFRRAICGVPTSDLNKLFPSLYGWIRSRPDLDFVSALETELQKRRYPRDEEFRDSLVSDPIYAAGDRIQRTRFLLTSLERSYGHKEIVDLDRCTIEHIMPQTPNAWWQNHIGEAYSEIHDTWVNTLGNLTLSAYNSELSNKGFEDKRVLYLESNLQLNRSLERFEVWNEHSIQVRAREIAEQALQIWPDLRRNRPDSTPDEVVSKKKPYQLSILGRIHAVKSWVEVLEITVETIFELIPEKAEQLVDEYPAYLSHKPFRRSETLPNGLYLNKNWSAASIVRFCNRIIESVELSETDWIVQSE